ncbi:MAG: filamentous hemagglutinin N-terminal domain-containing protein [Microcoleaceae cyanobacterium]
MVQVRLILLCIILLPLFGLLTQSSGQAQIVPDQTLGQESSTVRSTAPGREQIEGGAIRGSNLFHSFQEFNVRENASVYFANPGGIRNILSRVTGRNPSNVLGQLGVLGNANLFLLNPNGILFGPNASLDIRGSFLATTASEIQLGESGFFSTLQPIDNPLLTVNPSALFFNQLLPRGDQVEITNQSIANGTGLQVAPGQTLGLVGQTVVLDGGVLTAPQGRVELGGVSNPSVVGLNLGETGYVLDFSQVANPSDVQLRNGALVNLSGPGSGNLQVMGRQVTLAEGSTILADTFGDETGGYLSVIADCLVMADGSAVVTRVSGSGQGSDLEVNAEQVEMTGALVSPLFAGGLSTSVELGATGQAGDLAVNAQRLFLSNGAQIESVNSGQGIAGQLTVQADEIYAVGVLQDNSSGFRTDLYPGATGQAGDVTVNTRTLTLRDGAQIGSAVFGNAEGGNITVNAFESIDASGAGVGESLFPQVNQTLALFSGQFPSGLLTTVFAGGIGDGGDLTVNTPRLTLQNGSLVAAGTINAPGNSGQLNVQADEINVVGTSTDGFFPTSILTSVLSGATGQGGQLTVNTQSLNLQQGGQLRAGTSGIGDSGDVMVQANEINIDGISANGRFVSAILAEVEDLSDLSSGAIGSGDGGNILLTTDQLTLKNGGQVRAGTFGAGQGGNIEINAGNMNVLGLSPDGSQISGVFNDVGFGSTGNGGNLTLDTESLTLRDGGQLGANVFGSGQGGDLIVNATEIQAIGSGLGQTSDPQQSIVLQFLGGRFPSGALALVEPGATGSAGSLTVNTQRLTLEDGAVIGTGTVGLGDSGSLTVNADDYIEASGISLAGLPPSSLFTSVLPLAAGQGGDLSVTTPRLILADGGQVRSGTSGTGDSGNIDVRAGEIVASSGVEGFASGIIAEVEDFTNIVDGAIGSGRGGDITIHSNSISLQNGAAVSAATFGSGNGGNVRINASEIQVQGGDIMNGVAPGATGDAGRIDIQTQQLTVTEGGRIEASTQGLGQGGNVRINASRSIELIGASSTSSSGILVQSLATEDAGDIAIDTPRLVLQEGGVINSSILGSGNGGNITVNADEIEIEGTSSQSESDIPALAFLLEQIAIPSSILTTVLSPEASGQGGNVAINSRSIFLENGGVIGTGTFGLGNSGNLLVNTDLLEARGVSLSGFPASGLLTSVFLGGGVGRGGDLALNTERLVLRDGAQIRAGTSGLGDSGDLRIVADVIDMEGVFQGSTLLVRSGIIAEVEDLSSLVPGAIGTGVAGDIFIQTRDLTLQEGAVTAASTASSSPAGNLTIVADNLTVGNGALLTVSTTGSGSAGTLTILAANLLLDERAILTASAESSGSAGDLILRTRNLTIQNSSTAAVNTSGTGRAGNLFIAAETIQLLEGGQIAASTFGSGRGGEIEIQADSITARGVGDSAFQADGFSIGEVPSGVVTQSFATGDGGSVVIDAQRLSLQEGALIQASVFNSGDGGRIDVRADEIEATGSQTIRSDVPQVETLMDTLDNQSTSGILTTVLPAATGQGGDLTIGAGRIALADGAQIGAGTFGGGNSGNLFIQSPEIEIRGAFENSLLPTSFFTSVIFDDGGQGGDMEISTQNLVLQDGGQIRAGTSGTGDSGNLTLRADNIELIGQSANNLPSGIVASVGDLSTPNGTLGSASGAGGSISIQSNTVNVQDNAQITASSLGTGDGGSVSIQSNTVNIRDNAQITASSSGGGGAGSLEIDADTLQLNQGTLSAETTSGDQGNITLSVPTINLNNSQITTNSTGEATGGNINIDTQFLISRDSQISANAVQSQGGNVQITAEEVLLNNPNSITATSAFGLDGIVNVDTTIDPTQGTVELTTAVIDAESTVAQNPCLPKAGEAAQGGSFAVTGRGGLPPNPTAPTAILQGLVEWEGSSNQQPAISGQQEHTKPSPTSGQEPKTNDQPVVIRPRHDVPEIQQAQGWVTTPDGQIVLTQSPNHAELEMNGMAHPECNRPF